MMAFDYKNEKSFKDNYIKPLRNAGFISFFESLFLIILHSLSQ